MTLRYVTCTHTDKNPHYLFLKFSNKSPPLAARSLSFTLLGFWKSETSLPLEFREKRKVGRQTFSSSPTYSRINPSIPPRQSYEGGLFADMLTKTTASLLILVICREVWLSKALPTAKHLDQYRSPSVSINLK